MKIALIGLTGPTGAGKSTVAALLRDKGFYIIDGDLLAREVVLPGSPVLAQLVAHFGEDILDENGTLKRKTLASKAFADTENTARLNAITHPAITRKMVDLAEWAWDNGYKTAVIDAAALIESGLTKRCDLVVVVIAPPEVRLQRVLNRDALTPDEAVRRLNAQQPESWYRDNADVVIEAYEPFDIVEQTDRLAEQIQAIVKNKQQGENSHE